MPAPVLIVAAVVAVYANSLHVPFVYDSLQDVADNPGTQTAAGAWRTLTTSLRPVTFFSFAVNYAVSGTDVLSYHLVNLTIHLLAALTLFGIVRRTLMLPALAERFGRAATPLALVTALLWAVHPLQTESVTYVVQRLESLMGMFYLLTLYCAIRAVGVQNAQLTTDGRRLTTDEGPTTKDQGPATEDRRPRVERSESIEMLASSVVGHRSSVVASAFSILAVVFCALGMGSKEVMVTAPLLVLLYDRTFIAGSFKEALRRRPGLYAALAATWLIAGRSFLAIFDRRLQWAGIGSTHATPLEYAASEPGVILHYLGLTFRPVGLCLDYAWPVARTTGDILPGAIVVGALLGITAWALVRRPAWGFLGAWFFLILAPTSSVIPISDLAFEHRMYLPLAAVAAAAVLGLYGLGDRLLRRAAQSDTTRVLVGRIGMILALAAAVALGWLACARNADYRSEISIWRDTVQKRPANARAWNNLGDALARAGFCDEAVACVNVALRFLPDCATVWNNRARTYARLGRYDQAVRDADRAIELDPGNADFHDSRASIHAKAGQLDLALRDYDRAIELRPEFALAWYNRGNACMDLRRVPEAIRDYTRAVELKPDLGQAYYNRGNAYMDTNRPGEAISDYSRAIALNLWFASAYFNRGNAYADAGRVAEAVRDYTRAVALQPNYPDAYKNRAIALYELRQFDKAASDIRMVQKQGGVVPPELLKGILDASREGK